MKRSEVLQEVRKMRFEEAYGGWKRGRLTQQEAAALLGVCERTFRRYLVRYEEEGMLGLVDRRLGQLSHRRAPVDEVMAVAELYSRRYCGFAVKHCYSWYRRAHGGTRSYTWVKNRLQDRGW
ncbi:MAG TPA: helix-turn-helix domain-containing protein [Thermodesulfovibrionales bacterium]|nr:helix-turn-helix domain-containing protein [Thermodesulfovibrionales bacterium]